MKEVYRASTLTERKEFYDKEFSIEKVKKWFRKNGMELPQLCALDAGSESGIIIDKKLKDCMLYFKFSDLKEKIKKYIPEDIYYDRNVYKNPDRILQTLNFKNHIKQEFVFDIDSNNLRCKCPKKEKICTKCLRKTLSYAKKLYNELKKEFSNVEIVYSGRGFHVHVHDKRAFKFTTKEKDELNKRYEKYFIDSWVSRGVARNCQLIRMPYSLHGVVSRITTPLGKRFNEKKIIPNFLKVELSN